MYPTAITCLLLATAFLSHAETPASPDATLSPQTNAVDHWCGDWAGRLRAQDAPDSQLLPQSFDSMRRFFVEPQLGSFATPMATEPKVQIPKFWGTSWLPKSSSFSKDIIEQKCRKLSNCLAELQDHHAGDEDLLE